MAIVRGRCSNFDYCMVAERRIVLDVDVGAGAAFICPECGKALGAPPVASRDGGRRFALLLGAVIVVLGGGLYGAVLLQPGQGAQSRLPPWLDPAAQTHDADQAAARPPADLPPLQEDAARAPASTQAAARDVAPPPHVPPVPPRPNQAVPAESGEMAVGSAALLPLLVTLTNRLAAPQPATLRPAAPAAPPVVPAHLELPTNTPATTQDGVYGQYHDLVDGSRRLAIGFHFAPHAIGLDEAAMRDIDRLVKYVTTAGAQTGHVILVGFSDTDGSRPHSLDLSRRRAAVVAAVLAQHGVKVAQSAAFGADLPVASNATGPGRDRNRRVEVFVQP